MNSIQGVKFRRDFLKSMALLPIVATLMPGINSCTRKRTAPPVSKVVRVSNTGATDNSGSMDDVNLNEKAVQYMVDSGIKEFTGKSSVEDASKEIIPNYRKKVAIKVNCQITGIYTKSKIVNSVIAGLVRRGVSPSNIIINDLTDNAFSFAGFKKKLTSGIKIGKNSDFGGYSWIYWDGRQ